MSEELQCMIDLETLGLEKDAVVVSIGAAIFDATGSIYGTFYKVLSIDEQIGKRTIDPGTLKWWMSQSDEARAVFSGEQERVAVCLLDLIEWLGDFDPAMYWGNDPEFDLGKLEHLASMERVGPLPWRFFQKRDFRTIRMVLPEASERDGTYHNAMDDAIYQAKECARAQRIIAGVHNDQ